MGWTQRIFGQEIAPDASPTASKHDAASTEERMSPGMGSNYDAELREKAGMHTPPPPPEFMGVEGEYDPTGLAKRVALAFDRDPDLEELDTLDLSQNGSTIVLIGSVPNLDVLHRLEAVARQVDGTKAIDTHQITIEAR